MNIYIPIWLLLLIGIPAGLFILTCCAFGVIMIWHDIRYNFFRH